MGAMSTDAPEELPAPLAAGWSLLAFVDRDTYVLDTPFNQLLHGTFMRSRDTYAATCLLLTEGLPVQAAMLVRSLFEDMVVAHWLVLNHQDPDWLIKRFQRHRDAMALHQDRLQRETGWSLGRPLADASALKAQQNALAKEFGGEAQKDWWDPRSNGDGTGEPVGLRGIATKLEESAETGGLFRIRFAGGQEPLLARIEVVVHKWLTQFLHHTALGLPFTLSDRGEPELLNDPSEMVMFVAVWMFAQQVYLLHDVHQRDQSEFNEVFRACLIDGFGHLGASPDLIVTLPPEDGER
jgi:uncharacterized protein DUF5677